MSHRKAVAAAKICGGGRRVKIGFADVDQGRMERCGSCGATTTGDAAWCGQCFAPRGQSVATATPLTRPFSGPASADLTPLTRRTRWRKTTTTFGPLGRVLATIAVLLPLPFMVIGGLADPFVWGGAGFWVLVVLPWTMRDVWKAGEIPVG